MRAGSATPLSKIDRLARQRVADKPTVRERIDRLLNLGSYREIGSIASKATHDATHPDALANALADALVRAVAGGGPDNESETAREKKR